MGVTENLSCWECDRCDGMHPSHRDDKIYMDASEEKRLGWERIEWQFDDGTVRSVVLGPDCATEYHDLRKMLDSQVTAFFNEYKSDKKEN